MNPFDSAIQMEKEGERYYRQMAEGMTMPGVKTIFMFLAEEEVRHAHILTQMSKGVADKLTASTLFADTQTIFKAFQANPPVFNLNQADFEVYDHALELEQLSERHYRQQAELSKDPSIKGIFNDIADEEARHIRLIEQLKVYSSRPHQWIENSEFNHLDHY
jgi:rubrerythrin